MGSQSKGTVVLIALLLLVGNVRCLMACESVPCQSHSTQSSIPPCHRQHHAPAHKLPADNAPADCSQPFTVADTQVSAAQANLADFVIALPWSPMYLVFSAPLSPLAISSPHVLSPPGLPALNTVMLRV